MPVTFNSNNNYSVDIVTEPDVLNPTVIKYSSDTNTPFVEIKITPDIFQYPLLAGNLNFDSLYRFIDWRAESTNGVNGNVNNSCTPTPTPHLVHSTNTFGATTFPGTLANGLTCSLPQVTNNVTESFQGPFQSERNGAIIYGDLLADGVAWTKVIWVEVYEDDNGQMINEDFSPEINEDLASWQLWNPNDTTRPITNNVYPYYIRAFVFLEYGPNGPGGLSNNINIQIDIDENTPIYGCTDPNATNYYAGATVDDGSCAYSPPPFSFGPLVVTSDISSANHVVYTIIGLNGTVLNAPIDVLVLNSFDVSIPTPTGGTTPYENYEIQALFDNATITGSPGGGTNPVPSPLVIINESTSIINSVDPFTYDMCYTTTLPTAGITVAGPGIYNVGKVFMEVTYDPTTSPELYALQDITMEVYVEDDAGASATSLLSIDIASQYN